jgi:hypothetical protein
MTDTVHDPPGEPPDEEPDEPDEDDARDWAAAEIEEADYVTEDLVEEMTEAVADGGQDMPEEEAGWARPFNQPRGEWRAV